MKSVTLDDFLLESNGLKFFTSSFDNASAAFESTMNDISARSVLFPPIIFPSEATALLFTPIPIKTSAANPFDISESFENFVTFPVTISTTDNLPSVIVPVLSLNKMLRLPAVSRPFIFLTNTLSFAILRLWKDISIEVSIGSPSGTAQTIIVTATVTASITNLTHSDTP